MKRKILFSLLILFLVSASVISGITLAEIKKKQIREEKLAQIKNGKVVEGIIFAEEMSKRTAAKVLGENIQESISEDLEIAQEENKNQADLEIKKETNPPAEMATEEGYVDDLTPEEDPDDIIEDPETDDIK